MLYLLAAYTGLRAAELASLSRSSLRVDGPSPSVRVAAADSKRRRRESQPLRRDVADRLSAWLMQRPKLAKQDRLWPGSWSEDAAEMLRRDLDAAGLPYVDEAGRYFDFHALRHQFISRLAAAGVHPKVAQELARHSTIGLTMDRYTHLPSHALTDALQRLPPLPACRVDSDTVEQPLAADGNSVVASMVALPSALSCPEVTKCDRDRPTKGEEPQTTKPLAGKGFDASWQRLSADVSKRGRRDLNPQPPDRQSGTLTN